MKGPPTVRIRIGPPVSGLTDDDAHRDNERIMEAIVALLPKEARQVHEPSAEELARTDPPGRSPTVPAAAGRTRGPPPQHRRTRPQLAVAEMSAT